MLTNWSDFLKQNNDFPVCNSILDFHGDDIGIRNGLIFCKEPSVCFWDQRYLWTPRLRKNEFIFGNVFLETWIRITAVKHFPGTWQSSGFDESTQTIFSQLGKSWKLIKSKTASRDLSLTDKVEWERMLFVLLLSEDGTWNFNTDHPHVWTVCCFPFPSPIKTIKNSWWRSTTRSGSPHLFCSPRLRDYYPIRSKFCTIQSKSYDIWTVPRVVFDTQDHPDRLDYLAHRYRGLSEISHFNKWIQIGHKM